MIPGSSDGISSNISYKSMRMIMKNPFPILYF